jgi:hypothetical protein
MLRQRAYTAALSDRRVIPDSIARIARSDSIKENPNPLRAFGRVITFQNSAMFCKV